MTGIHLDEVNHDQPIAQHEDLNRGYKRSLIQFPNVNVGIGTRYIKTNWAFAQQCASEMKRIINAESEPLCENTPLAILIKISY